MADPINSPQLVVIAKSNKEQAKFSNVTILSKAIKFVLLLFL